MQKEKTSIKFVVFLLAAVLTVGLLPVFAFAANVTEAADKLETGIDNSQVKTSFDLPTQSDGYNVTWHSNNPEVVLLDGSRALVAQNVVEETVRLTATVSDGIQSAQKNFDLTVPAYVPEKYLLNESFTGIAEGSLPDTKLPDGSRVFRRMGDVADGAVQNGKIGVYQDGTNGVLEVQATNKAKQYMMINYEAPSQGKVIVSYRYKFKQAPTTWINFWFTSDHSATPNGGSRYLQVATQAGALKLMGREKSIDIGSISTTDWHTVTFVGNMDNLTYDYYLDGKQWAKNEKAHTQASIAQQILIGMDENKTNFDFLIDDIKVYSFSPEVTDSLAYKENFEGTCNGEGLPDKLLADDTPAWVRLDDQPVEAGSTLSVTAEEGNASNHVLRLKTFNTNETRSYVLANFDTPKNCDYVLRFRYKFLGTPSNYIMLRAFPDHNKNISNDRECMRVALKDNEVFAIGATNKKSVVSDTRGWHQAEVVVNSNNFSVALDGKEIINGVNVYRDTDIEKLLIGVDAKVNADFMLDDLEIISREVLFPQGELTLETLGIVDPSEVTENLSLPQTVPGAKVTWVSSNPQAISNSGIVARPIAPQDNAEVTLYAYIEEQNMSTIQAFHLTVPRKEGNNTVIFDTSVKDKLTAKFNFYRESPTAVTTALAVYDREKKLVGVTMQEQQISANVYESKPVTLALPDVNYTDYEAKGFIWDSSDGMKPLAPPASKLLIDDDTMHNLTPFWDTDIMYNEMLTMVEYKQGQNPSAPLMFKPDHIIALRNAEINEEYVRGVDWDYDEATNSIYLLPGTKAFYFTYQDYVVNGNYQEKDEHGNVIGKAIVGGADETYFHRRQLAVTYVHDGAWDGHISPYAGANLPKTMAKLQKGEPLKLELYGDSIARGAQASGYAGLKLSPFVPIWGEMVKLGLEERFGSEVTFINPSQGGKRTDWGVENVESLVSAQKPDLVIIAFGMNDGNYSFTVDTYINNIKAMMASIRQANPDVEFILTATMLPNQYVGTAYKNQPLYEEPLSQLAGEGVAFLNMTQTHRDLLRYKRFVDMTGDNMYHPNDFLVRWYAQEALKLFYE